MTTTTINKPLDAPTAILKRRNVRHFKTSPIAPELLNQLIELTQAAPTNWNIQDWTAILVQEEAQKKALSEAAWGQQQVVQAPVTFVFIVDLEAAWSEDVEEVYQIALDRGAWPEERIQYLKKNMPAFQQQLKDTGLLREYAVKDAMIAATHLMIAAESLGLTSSIMNGWVEEQVKNVVGIADKPNLCVAILVALGYPEQTPGNPGRLPVGKRFFVGNLNQPYPG